MAFFHTNRPFDEHNALIVQLANEAWDRFNKSRNTVLHESTHGAWLFMIQQTTQTEFDEHNAYVTAQAVKEQEGDLDT